VFLLTTQLQQIMHPQSGQREERKKEEEKVRREDSKTQHRIYKNIYKCVAGKKKRNRKNTDIEITMVI